MGFREIIILSEREKRPENLAAFFDFNDLASFVMAAIRTNPMRQPHLAAVITLH
jgi:hypothetical protein